MELKPGYKQTEVGMIPEDWDYKKLKELCKKITDGTHDTPKPIANGIPFLTAIHVKESGIDYGNCLYLRKEDHEIIFARCNPQKGDVLLVNIGAAVATTAVVSVDYEFSLKNVALLKPSAKLLGSYLNYWLSIRKESIVHALSSGGAQPFLPLSKIAEIQVPTPTLAEQERISQTLIDADALLVALESLIAKKRHIKQAAMQELLTGKRRLPGFEGEWEVKRLGEIGSTFGGLTGKTKSDFGNGDAHYVTFMNVMMNVEVNCECFERVRVASNESQNRVLRGDLLFNGSSETPHEVAMCSLLTKDVSDLYLNSFCFGYRLRADAPVSGLFLAYLIRSDVGREVVKSLAQGSTRYNLSKSALLDAAIQLPNIGEQTAIATVLSDMDDELASLEARLGKARELKQGMMQQLLTGKIRLR